MTNPVIMESLEMTAGKFNRFLPYFTSSIHCMKSLGRPEAAFSFSLVSPPSSRFLSTNCINVSLLGSFVLERARLGKEL